MNIRQAILKAADHIEQNPQEFSFASCDVPHKCGTPGCAIGWIGFYLGHRGFQCISIETVPLIVGRLNDDVFYKRMDEAVGTDWICDSDKCARGLRIYADKYHPAESRALIPESVARIFRMSHAELTRELERA